MLVEAFFKFVNPLIKHLIQLLFTIASKRS